MKYKVDSLELTLVEKPAHRLSLESLVKVLDASRTILRELDTKKTLDWTVTSAGFNSPFSIGIAAEAEKGFDVQPDVVDRYLISAHVR